MSDSLETPRSIAHQAPRSVGFPRQEYWSGLPFPSPVYLPNPGIEPISPALQADSLPLSHQGSPVKKAQHGKSTLFQLKQKGWQTNRSSKVDVVSSLPQQEK